MKKYNFLSIIPMFIFLSCGLNEIEPYDTPFVHIMKNEALTTVVTSNSNFVATYSVYFSSSAFTQNLEVTYEIKVGDGLLAGRDFEMVTTGNKLIFMSGIYDMPIRIRWLPNPVDPAKDNTLKIILVSNNQGVTMGLPGPDQLQKQFTITKAN